MASCLAKMASSCAPSAAASSVVPKTLSPHAFLRHLSHRQTPASGTGLGGNVRARSSRSRSLRGGGGPVSYRQKPTHGGSSRRWLDRQERDEYTARARKMGSPSRAIFKLEQIDRMSRGNKGKGRTSKSSRGLFRPTDTVVDLGASPGGWSLYASRMLGDGGGIVAVDLLSIDPSTESVLDGAMADFHFVQGDFRTALVKEWIADGLSRGRTGGDGSEPLDSFSHYQRRALTQHNRADVIMSDMAANFTGDRRTDTLRTMSLCLDALVLAAGSSCLTTTGNSGWNTGEAHKSLSATPTPVSWQEVGLLRVGGTFLCKYFQCGQEDERELVEITGRLFDNTRSLKPPASRKESAERYLLATGFRGTPFLLSCPQDLPVASQGDDRLK